MTNPHATPDDGRPSTASRARLAAELHEQLAASRMAWDAALLRSDAAIAAGDQAAADEALEDHRQLLGALEERLGAVVAAAVVAREAEDVVRAAGDADVTTSLPSGPGIADGPSEAHGTPTALIRDGRDGPVAPRGAGRRAVTSLLGAAAAVALLAGVLVGDLPLDPRGSIAGSSTGDADQLRAQVASQRVRDALTEFGAAGDGAASRTELPAFSGSLPPAAAAPATPAGSSPDEVDPPPPAAEDPSADAPADDDRTDVPVLDLPTDAPTAPERPEPGPLGELLGDLDGRDGVTDDATDGRDDADDGTLERDVDTSTPRPLRDVTEQLRAPETAPSASDPTGGLG